MAIEVKEPPVFMIALCISQYIDDPYAGEYPESIQDANHRIMF